MTFGPDQLSSHLRRIASKIEASSKPNRELVVRELRSIISRLASPAAIVPDEKLDEKLDENVEQEIRDLETKIGRGYSKLIQFKGETKERKQKEIDGWRAKVNELMKK